MTTTTMIQTYFRIKDDFVPIEKFSGSFPDKDYIEGAIVCSVSGKELFQLKHYDLIDQLWAYIVDGLSTLQNGKEYDVFFPDQPIRLRFKVISPHCVEISIGDETNNVDYDAFRSTLKSGAVAFFAKMKEIYPEASNTWQRYQMEAEMIPG